MTDGPSERCGERLQKVLARAGLGSRRTCEGLIADGRVTVNGEIAQLGGRVDPASDRVAVDGVPVPLRIDSVYLLLNKPAGVISTASDTHGRRAVVDLVPDVPRVFPVGRLDAATEGLIILTNDGEFAQMIAHPSHGVRKSYVAEVAGNPSAGALRALREGVDIGDGRTSPAEVSLVEPSVLKITIHEGRNRQVRRMCDAVGHPVVRLVRTRIGSVAGRNLTPGQWRELSREEVRALLEEATTGSAPGRRPRT